MRRLLVLVACLLLPLAGSLPVRADQKDPRLDALFARLRKSTDAHEAAFISREIRVIWRQTENDTADTFVGKGSLDVARGHIDDALAAFDRAIAAAPDFAEAWNRRAVALYLKRDFKGAIVALRRTLALEPRHFGALSELGAIYMNAHQDKLALGVLKRALAIDPFLAGARENVQAIRRRDKEAGQTI